MIWKEKYRIGVPMIDKQHKELFRRITEFVEALRSDGSWESKTDKVNSTLDFMKIYVVTHFKEEEELQKRIGYPLFEAHQKIHNDFVDYVNDVASQYEKSGYDEKLMQQFAGKLLAWLINHVIAEDQKIAGYLRSKEGKSNG